MTQGMDASGSVVRRWQLAAALKAQREQAGLTQEQAIDRLGTGLGRWSRSKLSRVENREHHVKPREVEQLLDAYGVTDPETRETLVRLAAPPRERGWWLSFGGELPEDWRSLLGLESGLIGLRDFQSQLVHGLLQTSDYARALYMSIDPGVLSPAEVERRVALRVARQQILAKDPPPQLHFILDETILQRLVGDRIVMHDQMRKLLQATEKPNITVQVLPRDVGASPGLEGPFTLLTLPAPIPDIGYTEGPAGTLYVEDRDRVRYWMLRFGILTQRALSHQESAELIAEAMHNYQ
ncbi:MAG: helix-turn-helix domain-containing protein [Pseudonocardiaceae bacterium]